MKRTLAVLTLLAALHAASAQSTVVPPLMSYQGRVSDATGTPIGATTPVNRTILFKFYTAGEGGTPVYAESQTVTISDGNFSVLIGNGTGVSNLPGPASPANPLVSLPSLFNGDLYLGITVDDGTAAPDAEITPRQRIVSAAYAFRARVADAVADNALSTAMLADSSVTTNKIGAAQVTTAKLADANVTTVKLADAAVTAAKLDTSTIGLWTPVGSHVYRPSGNVGIGQASPGFPLNFASSFGDKISLHGNSGAHYGLGVQNNLLQIHTNSSSADIAFGYGSSASFTENLRIRGNGNLGLGITTPSEKLHVNGGNLLVQNSSAPALKLSTGSATAEFGLASSSGNYSTSAASGDVVLRSGSKLHMQSGSGSAALTVDNSNRVGIGTVSPSTAVEVVGALHARDSGVTPDNIYKGVLRTTRPTSAAQHINLVRSGSAAWSIGYVPNSTTFGIGAANSTDSAFNPLFRMTSGGQVSIGTSDTRARLNVGSVNTTFESYGRLTTNGGNSDNNTYTNTALSIYATGHVLASQFDVSSDARLKTDLSPSDSAADLATLSALRITDYRFKDPLTFGSGTQKKVVAQQVEQVFPQAVSSRPGVVPDIYRHAEVRDGWVLLATDLRAGDRVRLVSPEHDGVFEVLEVAAGAFRLDLPASAADVFVYGREVPDLKSVDYDALAMLNISATQELHRKLTALEAELAKKDADLVALERRLQALEARLSASR